MILSIALVILAYLSGSICSAILVCRCFQLTDPRDDGSKNPGATNVMRLHGKRAAIFTLAGDILKGFLPVVIAAYLQQAPYVVAVCGLAAFAGHLFPVFFGFRGGKGVATFIGVLFGAHWILGMIYVVTWLGIACISRYSSLSALVATVVSPVFSWFIMHSSAFLISHVVMMVLLIWRHYANIQNLISGKETKIGQSRHLR